MDTVREQPKPEESELSQPIWAIVTHNEVVVMNATYAEALKEIETLKEKLGHKATIVTDAVAQRMIDRAVDIEDEYEAA